MNTKDTFVGRKSSRFKTICYHIAVMFLPNIFLFNLYSNSRHGGGVVTEQVLFLAIVLSAISVISLLIIRIIVRSYEASLLILLFFWITFWFFRAIHARLFSEFLLPNSQIFLLCGIAGIIICLMIFFRTRAVSFKKIDVLFNALLAIICLLFVFNALPIFWNVIMNNDSELNSSNFYIRRTFNADSTLPNPDIYWFHMDGMISFASMEEFFNEPQTVLRQQLQERGFAINEDAEFITSGTTWAVPALLSPDLYDSYLGDLLLESSHLLISERESFLSDALKFEGRSRSVDIAPYHELLRAFLQIDYTVVMIAEFDPNVYVPIDHFYCVLTDEYPLIIGDVATEPDNYFLWNTLTLLELLTLTTPIPSRAVTGAKEMVIRERIGAEWKAIPTHDERINNLTANTKNLHHERQLYRRLIDSFSTSQPRILYLTSMFTHSYHWRNWFGEDSGDESKLDLYPLAHEYAGKVMINMIDMILEHNPNAIIVLQADHGFHMSILQDYLLSLAYSEEDVIRLLHSVMSAVRIPEQYGGLDEPLDPRNITRELINRFVGKNYPLID